MNPRTVGPLAAVASRRGTARLRAGPVGVAHTVGTVPPSITCSLPVMLAARSDARKAISAATSAGVDGRPSGIPPSESMIIRRPPSRSVPASAASRSASRTEASVSIQPGDTLTTRTPAVARLEAGLGARLFNRTTRSVALTDAGRAFVDQLGPALHDVHAALDAVRSRQSTPSGTLRINAFATAARGILSPLVLRYLARHPQVHVDLVTEGRLVDIVAEGFDLGVRNADLVPSDMVAVPIGPAQRYAVVATPAYLEARGRPRVPPDLLGHACIRVRLPNGALFRWPFEKRGRAAQIDVNGPITLDEPGLARTAALAGVGIGFFMEEDVRADVEAGRLERVLDDWTPPRGRLCLYYPGRRHASAALRAFVEMARELDGPRPATR